MRQNANVRKGVAAMAAATALLLAGCGAQTPKTPTSSNALPSGAANTTSATAYGADIHAAQSVTGILQQSAQRDVGGATTP